MPRKKSAISVIVDGLTAKLEEMQPEVLDIVDMELQSFHGKIGGKYNDYIDSVRESFLSPQQFITEWESGLLEKVKARDLSDRTKYGNAYQRTAAHEILRMLQHKKVWKYTRLFHERNFFRNYTARTRQKPSEELWELWMGQTAQEYGLLITPRFDEEGEWENDVSEIRHADFDYWTIGHVLESGIVVPTEPEPKHFADVEDYLWYFRNVLVRANKSKYGDALAKRYADYVLAQDNERDVPLLIPEFRYEGKEVNHKYRLDFCIFSAPKRLRLGIELSPWSTHGQVKGVTKIFAAGGHKAVDAKAKESFEKEMAKRNAYFKKFGITALTFTDSDLKDMDAVFADIEEYLGPQSTGMPSKPEVEKAIASYKFR